MFGKADDRVAASERRRQLHVQIARSRRRLNQHSARLIGGGFLPRTWRQQIQNHPVLALATAAGVGMLLAQLCSRGELASKTADRLAQCFAGRSWTSIMRYVERFLSTSDLAGPLESEQEDA